jgi:hypothetical protein
MPKYFVYHVDPIDHGWHMLHVLEDDLPEPIAAAAKGIGWEGDVRGHSIGWLPMPTETAFLPCYVWKQDNNGQTFIASPTALQFGRDAVVESTTVDVLSNLLNVGNP